MALLEVENEHLNIACVSLTHYHRTLYFNLKRIQEKKLEVIFVRLKILLISRYLLFCALTSFFSLLKRWTPAHKNIYDVVITFLRFRKIAACKKCIKQSIANCIKQKKKLENRLFLARSLLCKLI